MQSFESYLGRFGQGLRLTCVSLDRDLYIGLNVDQFLSVLPHLIHIGPVLLHVLLEVIKLINLPLDCVRLGADGLVEKSLKGLTSILEPDVGVVRLVPVALVFLHEALKEMAMAEAVCLELLVAGVVVL